jgi:hypothetical protein
MTMNSPSHYRLPNPNDTNDIRRHREAVFNRFGNLFALADSALRDSIPKAKNMFALLGGNPDRAVHAMNTRYLMKVFLRANDLSIEDQPSNGDLSIEWVPNCGLFVRLADAEVRILKMGPFGLPKATSVARSRYYSSNQMLLKFSEEDPPNAPSDLPLALVLLWDIDEEYKYLGLEVACPRTTKDDGTVDCFWIEKWDGGHESRAVPTAGGPDNSGSDLEGIGPMDIDNAHVVKA